MEFCDTRDARFVQYQVRGTDRATTQICTRKFKSSVTTHHKHQQLDSSQTCMKGGHISQTLVQQIYLNNKKYVGYTKMLHEAHTKMI